MTLFLGRVSVFFDEAKSVGHSARAFYFLAGGLINCMNRYVQMDSGLITINQGIGSTIDTRPLIRELD